MSPLSKRWGIVVDLGWGWSEVAHGIGSAAARVTVLSAFGVDAVGAVVCAAAAAFWHHRGALAAGPETARHCLEW
jgi:hypothetical protein